jgi:hypothetical protein
MRVPIQMVLAVLLYRNGSLMAWVLPTDCLETLQEH